MDKSPSFAIAPNMSIKARFTTIIVLSIVAIVLQIAVSVGLGVFFMFAASLFGMLKRQNKTPNIKRKNEWKSVTIKEYDNLLSMLKETDDVKRASGSSVANCGCIAGLVIVIIVIAATSLGLDEQAVSSFFASMTQPIGYSGELIGPLIVDAAVLILPIWLSGQVSSWEPSDMRVKIEQLKLVHDELIKSKTITLQPSMLLAETTNGTVPIDVKLMVKPANCPEDFYGIQLQTTMNSVQGKEYPYTYCVLIAKPSFGLLTKLRPLVTVQEKGFWGALSSAFSDKNAAKEASIPRYDDALVEAKAAGDVEIAVVRQATSGTGYTTEPGQVLHLFDISLCLAEQVLPS